MDPAPPADAPTGLDIQALRRRVAHLEGLILAMDAAHEAREASPSEAADAACQAAYGALLYAAAQMRGEVAEHVPIPAPEELYLNIHVRVDLSGGPEQVSAHVAVDAQGMPVADAAVARELLHTVMPALRRHAADAPSAIAQREGHVGGAGGPLPIEGAAPETVRITLMWTGDPRELDLALLALRENGRALRLLDNQVHVSESTRRVIQAERLARQLLVGALGEDLDEDVDDEPHEHLTVVRHDRGGNAPVVVPRGGPADGGAGRCV